MKKSSLLASTLALTLAISSLTPASVASAASKLSLSTKKVTLNVNKSTTVSANQKVTWKTSNKKIAQVKKLSNKKAKITAKRVGSCKITAIKGKTKAVIRVTVKKPKTTVTTTTKPTTTVTPVTTPKEAETTQPLKTLTPEEKEQLENAIPVPMPDANTTPAPVTEMEKPITTPAVATCEPTVTPTVETVAPVTTPQAPTTTQPLHTLTPEEKEKLENAIPVTMPGITVTPLPTQDATVYTASASGITLSVTDCTTTGIKLTITNNNDTNITFGENYSLQKLENGSWKNVPYIINNWAFTSIGIVLPANSSYKKTINWESFHGALNNGTYRIVKDFYKDVNSCNIACEFIIDETTPTQAPASTPVPKVPTATTFAFLAD